MVKRHPQHGEASSWAATADDHAIDLDAALVGARSD
jgi:hypothetical protein